MRAFHVIALLMAGLAGGCSGTLAGSTTAKGYGERPQDPHAVIAALVANPTARIVRDPDPFFVRDERGWHYGWRVCTRTEDGDRAFFLMRGDEVIYSAIANGQEEGDAEYEDVARNCPDGRDG